MLICTKKEFFLSGVRSPLRSQETSQQLQCVTKRFKKLLHAKIIIIYRNGYEDGRLRTAGVRDWHNIWLSFAGYALVIAIAFAVLFKHKHNPEKEAKVSH